MWNRKEIDRLMAVCGPFSGCLLIPEVFSIETVEIKEVYERLDIVFRGEFLFEGAKF